MDNKEYPADNPPACNELPPGQNPAAGRGQDQPPAGGQAAYRYGYPPENPHGAQYYGAPTQSQSLQQQQQQVVVVNDQQQLIVVEHIESFIGHIIFAVCVFCFCCPLFGLIAFILGVVACSNAVPDPPQARKLGQASLRLSIAGIIVGVIVIIAVSVAAAAVSSKSSSCKYQPSDTSNCYRYRSYVHYWNNCDGYRSDTYCYTN